MIERLDAILQESTALGIFVFVLAGILLCFLVAAAAVLWIGLKALHYLWRAAIRYAVRRIRRWFVEEVLLPKARADYNAVRARHSR